MGKPSFILQALGVLSMEDIHRITSIVHEKQAIHKKAAGGELVFWEDPPSGSTPKKKTQESREGNEEAKVLPFSSNQFFKEKVTENITKEEEPTNLVSTDSILWQREMSKNAEGSMQKTEALGRYKRSTEMYVVKTHDETGKEKLKFASTDGVLINKKQA
jgi:hypothetical protein